MTKKRLLQAASFVQVGKSSLAERALRAALLSAAGAEFIIGPLEELAELFCEAGLLFCRRSMPANYVAAMAPGFQTRQIVHRTDADLQITWDLHHRRTDGYPPGGFQYIRSFGSGFRPGCGCSHASGLMDHRARTEKHVFIGLHGNHRDGRCTIGVYTAAADQQHRKGYDLTSARRIGWTWRSPLCIRLRSNELDIDRSGNGRDRLHKSPALSFC